MEKCLRTRQHHKERRTRMKAGYLMAVMAAAMVMAGGCTVFAEDNSLKTEISGSLSDLFREGDDESSAEQNNEDASGDLEGGSVEAPADDAYKAYRDAALAYLDENNIQYAVVDDETITITYDGENMESVKVFVVFNAGAPNYVVLSSWNLGNFDESHLAAGYKAMNEINNTYKWVKFYLDDDNDVTAKSDLIVDLDSCGEEILNRVLRVVWVSDEAYPVVMSARWSN